MPHVKKLTRIGNSYAVIIDRPIMQQLDLTGESEVELAVENHRLVVVAHRYANDEKVRTTARSLLTKRRRLYARLSK